MQNTFDNTQLPGDDELKGLSPALSQQKRDNAFAVPDGYFELLPSEVMKKIESAPDFDSVSNEQPFSVPSGYFDSLPAIIQQRIIDNKRRRFSLSDWISETFFRPVPRYAIAFASISLILLFSIRFFNRTITVDYNVPQLSEAEQLDAACLAVEDESTLAEVYSEETSPQSDVQVQGLENYLLDNDIDLSSITEKL